MRTKSPMERRLTILVNSCDGYADLWNPFFILLKKYWNPEEFEVILNTETKEFSYPGMNVRCVHSATDVPYGARMLNVLKEVKTEYVLIMLDDFFLRSTVDESKIESILEWMDKDKDIACFNCDPNLCYEEFEVNKYPGFRRVPPGNSYILSLQAGIWRTKSLKKYWRPNVTPWEWEELCSAMTTKFPKDKFYCINTAEDTFLDYGHKKYGGIWGVYRGKWIVSDVGPLFEKENIQIDYSIRGTYDSEERKAAMHLDDSRKGRYGCVFRCLGLWDTIMYFIYCRSRNILRKLGKPVHYDYFRFLRDCARKKHLRKRN